MEKRKVLRLRSIDKEAEKAKRRKTLHSSILKLLKVGFSLYWYRYFLPDNKNPGSVIQISN
jgi:hypothetical protein